MHIHLGAAEGVKGDFSFQHWQIVVTLKDDKVHQSVGPVTVLDCNLLPEAAMKRL